MAEASPLDYLISAYLNEDVFDLYSDVMAGVDDFVRRDPALIEATRAEIDQVIRTHSDEEIDDLLTGYGIGFVPGELGYRRWLAAIADRLSAVSGASRSGS